MAKGMCWNGLQHQNLKLQMNTKFNNKVLMFEEALKFENAIILCYGQNTIMANRTNGSKGWSICSCTKGNCVCLCVMTLLSQPTQWTNHEVVWYYLMP